MDAASTGYEVPFSFISKSKDLSLNIRVGSSYAVGHVGTTSAMVSGRSYGEICTAPCQATISTGIHPLALSESGGNPVETAEPIRIDGPSTLEGTYVSNAKTRTTGLIAFFVGAPLGLFMMIHGGLHEKPECDEYGDCYKTMSPNWVEGGLGGVLALGVTFYGLGLATKKDEAYITVTPKIAASLDSHTGGSRSSPSKPGVAFLPRGIDICVAF
jgi:hypothetical protein